MRYRILYKTIERAVRTFPAVVITGPRQSGKTTLLKNLFGSTHTYVNLENLDVRNQAINDPNTFLNQYKAPLIIDEIQYAPDLLSYIKTKIDDNRKPAQWLITGSQNFVLMHGVTQSLAGRAAILSLLPFSLAERLDLGENSVEYDQILKKDQNLSTKKADLLEILFRGSYPEIVMSTKVDQYLWADSYITTYLERDIRNLSAVENLLQFELFLKLCAIRTGQMLNLSEIAKEVGVSVPTANRWLSLLQTGYQIFLLQPYYKNFGKRLIKRPKLYFNDTALACYLFGIKDYDTLMNSPSFPQIFETFIITDFWKRFTHFGQHPSLYYMKTRDGLEVDLAVESNQKLDLFEIKSGSTITSNHANSLLRAKRDLGEVVNSINLISNTKESFILKDNLKNYRWSDILSL